MSYTPPTSTNLKICSYNIRGFNETKINYLSDLLKICSILLVQEHWLNNNQLLNVAQYFPGFSVYGISAMDDTKLLKGRPNGGVLMIFPDSLGSNIKYITTTSTRLCAISLQIDDIIVYIFCVYMPCDVNETDNLVVFENVLDDINRICSTNNAENICIAGDINMELSRVNSWHTKSILQFARNEELFIALNHPSANVNYSYSSTSTSCFSIIDHFFVTEKLFDSIINYYSICDEIDNQSDHAPLIVSMDIHLSTYSSQCVTHKPRKKWNCATDEDIIRYQNNLDISLSTVHEPLDCIQCNNMLCNNIDHIQSVHTLHDELIAACINASVDIPDTSKKSSVIPGWNSEHSYLREISLLWRSIWISINSPRTGIVADIMRRTRCKYHYSIRKLKNNNLKMKREAMANAINNNKSRDLWNEVRKIRKKNSLLSNCIDNINGEVQISTLFANKYNDLYNSVKYEQEYMSHLFDQNSHDIVKYCINDAHDTIVHTHVITVDDVKYAIKKLKPAKADCIDGMFSDNLKHGTHSLFKYISLLFSVMLSHGIAPEGLLLSTLVPIPKNKRGNKCDSNNYRQIAISSLYGKLFDIIVLDKQHQSLSTDILQFGFKKNSSTITCTSLLLETIEYYNENNTDCYLLLLDASKAFDRVEYVKLFNTLRDRNMCPIVLRLLMNMYINQKIQVKWNSTISEKYHISNGVKQGGCLSPTLFSVYLNNLIDILRTSNIGCRYGSEYMGVFCYADDLSLLCPTLTGLREMLNICEKFALEYNIIFNAKKSQVLCFNSKRNPKPNSIKLKMRNGQPIPYVDHCMHLGNMLSTKTGKNVLIDNAVIDLNIRINNLLADFSHCDCITLSTLFKSYCMNVYGSQIWRFNDKYLSKFYTAWRKGVRRLWKLPYRTHNKYIHVINKSYIINCMLEKRCIKFIWNLINSEHSLYNNIVKYSLSNYSTTVGENIRYFMYKYNITLSDYYSSISLLYNKIDLYVNQHYNCDDECTAKAIRELCESRDMCDTQFFDRSELNNMIEMLCTR